jgi:type I restriction enzyme M protein
MPAAEPITIRQNKSKGQIWSHVRAKWLIETPEELVRQEYLCVLVNEYGFKLEQIDEEVSLPGERGNKNARADFVIWRTVEDRKAGKTALIVVECKADNVAIDQKTYQQGANYANNERAKFFVAHNRRSTKFFRVDLAKRAPNYAEIKNIPHASDSDKEIEALLTQLKPFEGKEFADLLHQCHNVIRNNEHLDPAALQQGREAGVVAGQHRDLLAHRPHAGDVVEGEGLGRFEIGHAHTSILSISLVRPSLAAISIRSPLR